MDFDTICPVSWYPGHMLKAERELREKLKLIDVIVNLVDARVPMSSRNPRLAELSQNKSLVVVLAKTDLSDSETTQSWIRYFRAREIACISLHFRQAKAAGKLIPLIIREADRQRRQRGATTPRLRPVRAMVVGLPNVGKSTLINLLASRKRAKTGPAPGVTRHQQWIKLDDKLELLDTPGVMFPRLNDSETGIKLGMVGTIKDSVIGVELLAEYLLYVSQRDDRDDLTQRYRLGNLPENVGDLLETVGRQTGAMKSGDRVRLKDAAQMLLRDFREGRLGNWSLETPPDDGVGDKAP